MRGRDGTAPRPPHAWRVMLTVMRSIVVDWNGRDLPAALRSLAPGRYVLAPAVTDEDEAPPAEDIAAVAEALASLDAAPGIPAVEAAERLRLRISGRRGQ